MTFVSGMNAVLKHIDPRCYQIAVLSLLLSYGVFALDFGIHWYNAVAIISKRAIGAVCMHAHCRHDWL